MKKHTKIYFDYFGYGQYDFVPCELTGSRAVDVHHIVSRGMGGSLKSDNIDNLMALTRQAHDKFGDISEIIPMLKDMHLEFMKTRIPIFNYFPTIEEIKKWKKS